LWYLNAFEWLCSVSCRIRNTNIKILKCYCLVIADFPEGFNFTKVKDEENLYQIENNGILSQGNILNCTCCALNAQGSLSSWKLSPWKPFVNYKN